MEFRSDIEAPDGGQGLAGQTEESDELMGQSGGALVSISTYSREAVSS